MGTSKKPIDPNDPDTYVTCCICGVKVRKLSCFHVEGHGIDLTTYKKYFPGEPITSVALRRNVSLSNKEKWETNEYFRDTMLDNLDRGRKTMYLDNPEIGRAKSEKAASSRRGKKNRLDHRCKGWSHLWESFESKEARDEFIHERFEWQNAVGGYKSKGVAGLYTDRLGRVVHLRSLHELATAVYLDLRKFMWMYEGLNLEYADERGVGHRYYPDFCIHDPFLYLEVKPFPNESHLKKLTMIRASNPSATIVMLNREEILAFDTWNLTKGLEEDWSFNFEDFTPSIKCAA